MSAFVALLEPHVFFYVDCSCMTRYSYKAGIGDAGLKEVSSQ